MRFAINSPYPRDKTTIVTDCTDRRRSIKRIIAAPLENSTKPLLMAS
jgi:hypothetical protein